jgi:hypothetical protein
MTHNGLGRAYSITSSARARSDGGMVRPSAFAVFMFTTSSNVFGWDPLIKRPETCVRLQLLAL